jgi:hypothetical protein
MPSFLPLVQRRPGKLGVAHRFLEESFNKIRGMLGYN